MGKRRSRVKAKQQETPRAGDVSEYKGKMSVWFTDRTWLQCMCCALVMCCVLILEQKRVNQMSEHLEKTQG